MQARLAPADIVHQTRAQYAHTQLAAIAPIFNISFAARYHVS
jgi:hypothetical protein